MNTKRGRQASSPVAYIPEYAIAHCLAAHLFSEPIAQSGLRGYGR
jgi:hypothetical protein